jgi:CBS-domain-containing membrane protein
MVGPDARSVMVTIPKTLAHSARVGDVWKVFEDDHVHMVLLTEGGRLRGTLIRSDIPASAAADSPARPYAKLARRTVAPDTPVAHIKAMLASTGLRRLAVVGEGGDLLGLICLKRTGLGFCSDAGVLARRASREKPSDRDHVHWDAVDRRCPRGDVHE